MTADDFEDMFHYLMRREKLREIFDRYSKGEDSWDASDLMLFLQQEQGEVSFNQMNIHMT